MTRLTTEQRRLLDNAATIDERFSLGFASQSGSDKSVDIAIARLEAWCSASAGGDWQLFERRLAMDRLECSEALAQLGGSDWSRCQQLPDWIDQAVRIRAAIDHACTTGLVAKLSATDKPPPFMEVIGGLIAWAMDQLEDRLLRPVLEIITDEARVALGAEIALRISELCAPHLWERFSSTHATAAGKVRSYNQFASEMQSCGFGALLDKRPVLARLLATSVHQWIDATSEFLGRLGDDGSELTSPASRRLKGTTELGDPHHGGRCVRLVIFEDDHRWIYKPRDVRIDRAWGALVAHFNRAGAPFTLRTPHTIVRDNYGWAEFIDHQPCANTDEADAFFGRAGAWLCLLHLFRATDMHEENLIACGADPVPVDLETLLQSAQVIAEDPGSPRFSYIAAGTRVSDSVLATGLLPTYGKDPQAPAMHGGLVDALRQERRIGWENVNTDHMRPVVEVTHVTIASNQPFLDGGPLDVRDHLDPLIQGYRLYNNFLLKTVNAEVLESLLQPFAGLPVRKLLRNTRFYSLLLSRARKPSAMTDGAIWSAQLDFVSRLADWTREKDPWWPLFRAEREALARLDIPHFQMRSDSSSISEGQSEEWESHLQDGISRTRSLFAALDSQAIDEQAHIISLAFGRVRTIEESAELRIKRQRTSVPLGQRPPTFAKAANAIAESIAEAAIEGESSASWIGLDWLRDSDVCQLAPLGGDLYNGAPGVSLFLSCHARTSRSQRSGTLALKGIAPLRADLLGMGRTRAVRALGPGGSSGLGSVIYAFSAIATLLNDKTLLRDALGIAELLTPSQFSETAGIDVMDGAAGAVLGLLALHATSGDDHALAQAQLWTDPLVHGYSRWVGQRASGEVPSRLTGMSHGAAGLTMAMLALAEKAEGDHQFALVEAAQSCLAWEDSQYRASRSAWPDLRSHDPDADTIWPCQWCHGAAGIGLARIRSATSARAIAASDCAAAGHARALVATLVEGVERAVTAVETSWPHPTDSLCCGSLGGIELLEAAAAVTGQRRLARLARGRLTEIVAEASYWGDYQWDIGDSRSNIGLFRGSAGVGLTLLRRLDGHNLPDVLTWR